MKSTKFKLLIVLAIVICILGVMLIEQGPTPTEPRLLFSLTGEKDALLKNPLNAIQDEASGMIFVADAGVFKIHVYDKKGKYLSSFGEQGFGDGHFTYPYGLLISSQGTLWVSDPPNHVIQEFTFEGKFLKRIFYGSDGTEPGLLAGYKDKVFVSDLARDQIVVLDKRGKEISSKFNQTPINHPQGLAIDSKGNLWVADEGSGTIQAISPDGKTASQFALTKGQRDLVSGLTVDAVDRIWVSFPLSGKIQVLSSSGEVLFTLKSQATLPTNLWTSRRNQTFLIDKGKPLIEVWSGVK